MDDEATTTVEEGVEVKEESPTSEVQEEAKVETSEEVVEEVKEEVVEAPKQPKHADAKDRIQFLVRENKTKESILAEKDKRIAELEEANSKKVVEDIPFPKEDDFESTGDFHKAMSDYNIKVFDTKNDAQKKSDQQETRQKEKAAEWDGFFDKAEALEPDRQVEIAEAIQDKTMPLNAMMQKVFQQSDVGPELVNHLHKNKDVAQAIANMPELQTVNELNKIASNLIKAKSAKSVTTAPAPTTPVTGIDVQVDVNWDDKTPEEWLKNRRKNATVN